MPESTGLTFHVMARPVSEVALFRDNDDRNRYLTLFAARLTETGCRCYGWALMDTHAHFLIKTSTKPLWALMKPLNTDYAHWYNRTYGRRGPLFADRFKSITTQDQRYLP